MFDIDANHIAALDDKQLRELIRRLCAAELLRHGLPLSALTAGGDQDAPDGGIDVRVRLPDDAPSLDFIQRPKTGFQAKKTNIRPADIQGVMHHKGELYSSVRALGEMSGAYIIVSGMASAADDKLIARIDAMKAAMATAEPPQLDFYDGPRLAGWVNDYPGVALWLRQTLGIELFGWRPWGDWSTCVAAEPEPLLTDGKALISDSRQGDEPLTAGLGIARLREELAKPRGIVRLIGRSGTGKTRLAEALFEKGVGDDPLPEDWAIYTDLGDSPNPSPQEMIPRLAASGRPAVMVIDNCPPETHKALAAQVRGIGGQISLLTIEYDVSDGDSEGTEVFRLDTASPEVIEGLLARRHQHLSQPDRLRITELAGANSRLALAMADAAPRGRSLARLTVDELFNRLFWQRRSPDAALQKAAEICSLVYSFDVEGRIEAKAELPILASLAGMDVEDLYCHVAELLRRQLAQKRGCWRAVLPHVLANRLAHRALQNVSSSRLLALATHPRLRTSFARRLGYLHDSDAARAIVEAWLAPDGMLGDAVNLDTAGWQIVHLITPTAPEATLRLIERVLKGAESAAQPIGTGWQRYEISRLLGHLAYEPDLFDRAVTGLAQLIPSERVDDNNHDSAANTLKRLFQINYSCTMAPMEQRLSALDRLLSDPAITRAACLALDAMLKAQHFDIAHDLQFGGRSRTYGWWPGSDEAITQWFAAALARTEAMDHGENRMAVRSILAHKFFELWQARKSVQSVLGDFWARLSEREYWPEGWVAVRRAGRLLAKKGKAPPAILAALAEKLAPSTLEQRIVTFGLSRQWSSFDVADIDDEANPMAAQRSVEDQVIALGRELANDPDLLEQFLPRLSCGDGGRLWSLGRGLSYAVNDAGGLWKKVVGALEGVGRDQRNATLLAGVLKGIGEGNKELAEQLLELASQAPALQPYLPYLAAQLELDDAAVDRLTERIRGQLTDVYTGVWTWLSLRLDGISGAAVHRLIAAVMERNGGTGPAVEMLSHVLHDRKRGADIGLVECARDVLAKWEVSEPANNMLDYYLGEISDLALAGEGGRATAENLCRRIVSYGDLHYLSAHSYPNLIKALLRHQPFATLDAFLVSQSRWGARLLWSFDEQSLIGTVPENILFSWAERDTEHRYPILAGVMCLFTNDGTPNPAMLKLIDGAPDRSAVLRAISGNLSPAGGWVGGLIATKQARAKGLQTLFAHPDRAVASWARSAADRLNADADEWQRCERGRDETFE